MSTYLSTAEQVARAAGKLLLDMRRQVVMREKGPRDLVSEADVAAQQLIRSRLLDTFPSHCFLGEEDDASGIGIQGALAAEYCWVVDPLDGTTNYLHQLHGYAVSIALLERGQILCGVVYDPILNECFTTQRGSGAFLNGEPLRTSGCQEPGQALVAASFSPLVERGSVEVQRFIEALYGCQGVRRLGSAALNLCYVAAGRLDAYWATAVKLWDVAAGILLLQEAGGTVTQIDGRELVLAKPEPLAAASQPLHNALFSLLPR